MSIAEHVLILETRYRIFKRVRKDLEHAPQERIEGIVNEYESMPRYKKLWDTFSAGLSGCGFTERSLEYKISRAILDGKTILWQEIEDGFRKPLERFVYIDDE